MKDLSISLRLCVFARIKKICRPVILRGRLQSRQGAKNWELFLCACLPQASAAKSISTLFPLYFFLFHEAKRSLFQPYFYSISYLFHEAKRSLFLFYFHCISSSVLCTSPACRQAGTWYIVQSKTSSPYN